MAITLNNGFKMPIIGLGVWRMQGEEVRDLIINSIKLGYRHFDCADVFFWLAYVLHTIVEYAYNTASEEEEDLQDMPLYACVDWPPWPGWLRLDLVFSVAMIFLLGALIANFCAVVVLAGPARPAVPTLKLLSGVACFLTFWGLLAFITIYWTAKKSSLAAEEPNNREMAGGSEASVYSP